MTMNPSKNHYFQPFVTLQIHADGSHQVHVDWTDSYSHSDDAAGGDLPDAECEAGITFMDALIDGGYWMLPDPKPIPPEVVEQAVAFLATVTAD
jgi:hypothetical protein